MSAADVLRLETDYESRQFEALDSAAADNLPPLSEVNLRPLAERLASTRARKRK